MPVDVIKLFRDVPGEFHVQVQDSHGAWHDAVMPSTTMARGANEYGYVGANTDTVYVHNEPAYDAPRASLKIKYQDGKTSTRIITETPRYANLLWEITLGGEVDASRV